MQYVTFACVKGKLSLSEVFSLRDSLYPMVILQMSLHNSGVYLKNYGHHYLLFSTVIHISIFFPLFFLWCLKAPVAKSLSR